MNRTDEVYLAEIDAESVRRGYTPEGYSLVTETGAEPWLDAWHDDPTLTAREQVANEIAHAAACAE